MGSQDVEVPLHGPPGRADNNDGSDDQPGRDGSDGQPGRDGLDGKQGPHGPLVLVG